MKIGYARVSTRDQNLALQLDALQKAGCEKIYQEKISAFRERPALNNALDNLRQNDTLLVWSLDRLGRSVQEVRKNIDFIQEKGATLIDITHNIDTSTSSGKLLIPFFSMLAEIDQILRKERTAAGWVIAKKEGRTGGRKPGLNDEAKKKAERAKKLYQSKDPLYSAREIASILNISTRTLYKYLRFAGVELKAGE